MTPQPREYDAVWLGIDIGTQSARVLAADSAGRVLARAAVALTSHRSGSHHEQDPSDWWSAIVRAAQVVTREVDASLIRGVSCCATSGTVLLVSASGDPVSPALMYDDGRAVAEAARAGVPPSWGLAKALWLIFSYGKKPGSRLAHQSDFVTTRLVGSPTATDWSNALKSGVSLESGTWPLERLASLGLDSSLLPPVVAPGAVLGSVSASASSATGIPAGTPVYAGLTDGCAAQVAAGALSPGAWNFVVGTTLVMKGCTSLLLSDPWGALYSHRSPDGSWWPGGASSAGAGVLSAPSFAGQESFAGADLAALDASAYSRGPVPCLAYPLVGEGERFPFVSPTATSFLTGDPRDSVDIYGALLQGVAFVERLCLSRVASLGADVSSGVVSLTGGGARSGYWNQLTADILGRSVVVPAVADGALGMAIVAAYGAAASGGSSDSSASSSAPPTLASVASSMVQVHSRYSPRDDAASMWDEPYARWLQQLVERGWLPSDVSGRGS